MELEILETIPISPSPPPPPSLHSLPLSHLDTDRNLHFRFRTLRLYSSSNNSPKLDPFETISPEAISSALSLFFPLAGSLHCRSDSRIEIHCSCDDSVPLVRAESKVPLSHLSSCPPGSPLLDCLAPDLDQNQNNDPDSRRPLLAFQITKFSCGGFALGMCTHHTLCDGSGANQFLTRLAQLTRGKTNLVTQPVWDRAELLGPRTLPHVDVPLDEILTFDADVAKNGVYGGGACKVKEWFHVSESGVERLRDGICKEAGFGFTTFEALSAFIWRARIKASNENKEEIVKMVYSMNISKIIKPPLPAGYWGNICVPVYVTLTTKDLISQPLWKTATLIKESKKSVTDEYVRSYIDFQELHYEKGINAGKRVFAFTDWRRLGHSEVDFGFGGPVSVMPLSWKLMGSQDPCFFLPCSVLDGGTQDGGFRVLVCLDETDLGLFKEEMKIFAE
ncbi:hypothetical protein LUZ60_013865 [Juncus effusus]|nr:hypothetical protein LUZ60_013865 [Juncus effusus]